MSRTDQLLDNDPDYPVWKQINQPITTIEAVTALKGFLHRKNNSPFFDM